MERDREDIEVLNLPTKVEEKNKTNKTNKRRLSGSLYNDRCCGEERTRNAL